MSRRLRRTTASVIAVALVSTLGCAALSGARTRPGEAEIRSSYYTDNSGLSVLSVGARIEQPVTRTLSATLRAVGDHVVVDRTVVQVPPSVSGNLSTGHADELRPDIVTSASSIVSGGAGSDKWRKEVAPGLRWESADATLPASASLAGRYSAEPDYVSTLVVAHGDMSLFENNATLAGFVGFGRDEIRPFEPPPGQVDQWPARHERWIAGASISQLLSRVLLISAGAALTRQRGMLSNPYRRATVRTSLFPEILPNERDRWTAFGAAALHLGAGAALHARFGAYTDSWSVHAIIPEAVLAKEIGQRWLVRLGYRHYRQSAARFYEVAYSGLGDIMAGDLRLGRISEHAPHADLEWLVLGHRDGFGGLRVTAAIEHSWLDYLDAPTDTVVGRVFQLGLLGSY